MDTETDPIRTTHLTQYLHFNYATLQLSLQVSY